RARLQSELRARADEVSTQLKHERAMRVRDEHRTALDDAALIGVRFRERLATAVRQVEGSERVPAGAVKPLALDREDLIEVREPKRVWSSAWEPSTRPRRRSGLPGSGDRGCDPGQGGE